MPEEKTPEEIAAEELEAQKARGDFVEEPTDEEETTSGEEEVSEEESEEESAADTEEEEDESEEVEEEDQPGDVVEEEEEEKFIPKFRYDNAQRNARKRQQELETRIEELESKSETEIKATNLGDIQTEIDSLSDDYEKALLDGEVEKATSIRHQRDKKQNEYFDMKLAQQGQRTSAATIDQMRYDAQLAQFEAKFPAINPESDDFDEKVALEVKDMIGIFSHGGFTLSAALNKAVHYVLREEPAAQTEDPDLVKKKRAQTGRKRVAKAIKKTPPDTTDKGQYKGKTDDDGLPDITKMSAEEFENLTPAQLKKLRGDSLSEEVA